MNSLHESMVMNFIYGSRFGFRPLTNKNSYTNTISGNVILTARGLNYGSHSLLDNS
jgi:hypothetical protein